MPLNIFCWMNIYEQESCVFVKDLDGIQNNDHNTDGVDHFHQHLQSFTVLNHFLRRHFIL